MGQVSRPLTPALSARHRLGAELRRWRQARRLSLASLGTTVHVSGDLLGKIEKAQRWPTEDLLRRCDEALQADGALVEWWTPVHAQRSEHDPVVRIDPTFIEDSRHLLQVLSDADNAVGVGGMQAIVSRESGLIRRARAASGGPLRRQLAIAEAQWLEFGSWVADNLHQVARADRLLRRAGTLAQEAGDNHLTAYVLMRRSQHAVENGDPLLATALAEQVTTRSELPPRLRALATVRLAHAHSLRNDAQATRASLNSAYRLLDHADSPDGAEARLVNHCTIGYVRAYEAACRLELGDPLAAVHDLQLCLHDWPTTHRLDAGLFRAYLALAYHRARRFEEAAAEARAARELAQQTGSRRTLAIAAQAEPATDSTTATPPHPVPPPARPSEMAG
jgi:transcriptional regulator with XRE-family HTH domain